MDNTEFKDQLTRRFLNNEATPAEIEVFFHLLKTGEADEQLLAHLKQESDRIAQKPPAKFSWMRVAASVVFILGLATALYLQRNVLRNHLYPVKYTQITVPNGEIRQLTLSDGTQVWINSGSSFRFPAKFGRDTREVHLEGEAFFDVAHNKRKSFIIHSDKIRTTVYGTSFTVKAYRGEQAEVTVKSGMVGVTQDVDAEKPETVMLTASQQVVYNQRSGLVKKDKASAKKAQAWKDGDLVFTGRTLKEMAPVMERWYNVDIQLDKDLEDNMMVGSYRKESLQNVLAAIDFAIGIEYEVNGRQVVLRDDN